jgi:hypothetical protein
MVATPAPMTTPPPTPRPPSPVQEKVTAFLRDYLAVSMGDDAGAAAQFFAPAVDYFEEGKVDRDYILRDLEGYHKRWPQQSQIIEGPPRITISADGIGATVEFNMRFDVRNGPSYIRGLTEDRMNLDLRGVPKILAVKSKVLEREKGGPPNMTGLNKGASTPKGKPR